MKNSISGFGRLGSMIALAGAALLSGCVAVPLEQPVSGYTCCNLRSYDGWISSNNVQGGDLIAAGEPAHFEQIKKNYYLYGSIGGAELALRDDNARSKEDTLRWANRIIVSENPRAKIAAWPAEVQKAISYGRVFTGMTREQVLMSLGYPSPADTPDLNAESWLYWTSIGDFPVDLNFGKDQRLVSIVGRPAAVRMIEAVR
ncbi:MAG: hypothetical protein ACO1NO_11475 [Burkholderiaceae bacterium]